LETSTRARKRTDFTRAAPLPKAKTTEEKKTSEVQIVDMTCEVFTFGAFDKPIQTSRGTTQAKPGEITGKRSE
jgi:hypothetical protein